PPLTTAHIPTEEIGRAAASLLLRRIARPGAPRQRSLVATSLVIRRSCGCEERPGRSYSPHQENPAPDTREQAL
ncbi:MAG: substrate-binding domain-containing protein, partial [Chloroflexota bacterium]